MEDFLGALLQRIEDSGARFSETAYTSVGREITPLLQILCCLYVAYYGLQILFATARIGVGAIIVRLVRMMIILALVQSWSNFNTFFYRWINDTPEDVGRAILAASGTGIREPTNGMSMIWRTANQAASAFAEQSGYFSFLPSMIGFFVMVGAGIFIAVALAILILAKVMLWVLIGTAPIFITCLLFEQSRRYGIGWFNQVLTYALIPLFVYVVAAFLIAAMNPELTKINAASGSRTLSLSDIAGFLLLCIAGAFVMLYIQSIGQGIAGGIATGVGHTASRWSGRGARTVLGASSAITNGGLRFVGRTISAFSSQSSPKKTADSSALQTKISQRGTPT